MRAFLLVMTLWLSLICAACVPVTMPETSASAASMEEAMYGNQVQYTAEWTIHEGGLETFLEVSKAAVGLVEANEPEMLAFHYYLNEDESKAYLVEWYANADAIPHHMQNVQEALGQSLEVSDLSRFEVFGDLTDGASHTLAGLGPQIFSHWYGFTRPHAVMVGADPTHGNQVQYTAKWKIHDGELDSFKEIASSSTELVEANEPEMLAFHWYMNEDESEAYLVEWYANADAITHHFQNVQEPLGALLEISDLARFEVFGDLTDGATETLAALRPQTFSHWEGFTR